MDHNLTSIFKALSNKDRRSILDLLSNKPMTTSEISNSISHVSRYAVMKHLNTLEEADLVVTRKMGMKRYNYLNAVPLKEVQNRWLNNYTSVKSQSLLDIKSVSEMKKGENIMDETVMKETFRIEQQVTINTSKEKVFNALTRYIDQWWSERLFRNSKMELNPMIGGQFIERGTVGQAALWGTITYIDPDTEIWLDGVLGMPGPITSFYRYKLVENNLKTTLMLSHAVTGPVEPETEQEYREGWDNLLNNRLKHYLEA